MLLVIAFTIPKRVDTHTSHLELKVMDVYSVYPFFYKITIMVPSTLSFTLKIIEKKNTIKKSILINGIFYPI